jgi:hypothetical protein
MAQPDILNLDQDYKQKYGFYDDIQPVFQTERGLDPPRGRRDFAPEGRAEVDARLSAAAPTKSSSASRCPPGDPTCRN